MSFSSRQLGGMATTMARLRVLCALSCWCATGGLLFEFRGGTKTPQIGGRVETVFDALDDHETVDVQHTLRNRKVERHVLPYLPMESRGCVGIQHGDPDDGCYAITRLTQRPSVAHSCLVRGPSS